jgi:Ca-activated chloride channel homolog
MRFESPAWLALLALIPLLAIIFVAGERQGARNLKRFAAARLLPVLGRSAKWPRVVRLILIMVTIAFLSLALARPSYGYHLREIHGKGADVIFAVDVSRSMLCTDISPDRLTRAKLAAKDLLETARGHRIGVIPFSREAFLQCPLTLDESAVSLSLDALNTSSLPKQGTSIAGPIAEARNAFADSGKNKRILVIFSDGEDLEGAGLQEARATKDMIIVTVGTGTVQGAPVPQSDATGSGYIRDDSGTLVTSRLDASNLESLAEATGGFYAPVNAPMLTLNFRNAINKDETESNVEAANIRVPIIRYRWPLAAALVLLIAEAFIPAFRRKGGAVLAILAMLLPAAPNPSDAAETTANPAAQTAAPANKKPAVPAGNPRESYNKGVELYKKGQYDESYAAFQKAAKDSAASPDDLRKQIYGNAGASKLAQALSLIPAGEEPMDPKDTEAARDLLNRAKIDLEKALSIAPDDAILQHNFKLVNDAFADLGKHKPKPQTKADQPKKKPQDDLPKPKKPDPLPTPKHKEEPPPPQKDNKDNKDGKGDKKDQNGDGGKDKDKDSKGGGQDQSGKEGGQSGSSGQNQGQSGQQDQPQGGQDQQQNPQSGSSGQNQQQNKPQQNQPQQQPQQQGQQPKPQQGQQQQQPQGGQQNQPQPQQGAGQDKQPQKQNGEDKKPQPKENQPQQQPQPKPQPQQSPKQEPQPKPSEEKKDSGKDKGNQPQAGDKQQAQPQSAAGNQSPKEQNAPQPGEEKKQPKEGEGENGKEKKPQPQPQPASAGDEEKREAPKPQPKPAEKKEGPQQQPQPQPAGAGNEEKREAPKPQPKPAEKKEGLQQPQPQPQSSLNQPKQTQSAAASTGGDQSPESTKARSAAAAEEPRREGEHTANLARPDMKPEDKKTVQAQTAQVAQAGDGKGDKQGEVVGEGQMTPVQAEQLLKILQNDENLLPSGQAKDQPLNNTSGRDW